jgi:hypothetical protein
VSSEPSSPGFVDPNARLLASVIPPAPPTLRARAARFVTTRRSGDLRSVVSWSRSREGRACFLAALAGVALTLGFYRSEASSAASAGPAPHHGRASATLAPSASVRSEPLALTPTATSAPTAAGADETAALAVAAVDDAADDGVDDAAPAPALGDVSDPSDAVRSAPRKAASAKSKGKKAGKHSRKAKRQSVAKASSRGGRRAKSQRTTATGPLAAWLATQRSKEASSSKRR